MAARPCEAMMDTIPSLYPTITSSCPAAHSRRTARTSAPRAYDDVAKVTFSVTLALCAHAHGDEPPVSPVPFSQRQCLGRSLRRPAFA